MMAKKNSEGKKLFVLDTNVLIHDPQAIWHFEEHDIFIPMVVLEELDNLKKGSTEMARNVRHASHFLGEMIKNATHAQISAGLPILQINHNSNFPPTGCIFFQSEQLTAPLPLTIASHKPDNVILSLTLALQQKHTGRRVV